MKKEKTEERTNNQFEETFNSTFNWFTESAQAFGSTYKKQLSDTFDVYKKFVESALESGKNGSSFESNGMDFAQKNLALYMKNIEMYGELTREILNSTVDSLKKNGGVVMNEEFADVLYHAFNNQTKQLSNINQSFIESLNKYYKTQNVDMLSITEKLQKKLNENIESSKSTFKAFIETYSKANNALFTSDSNLIEEMNKQIDLITKSNSTFWTELIKSISPEKDKKDKK